jgi:glycerophosphoryl diester phosphodiesterase
MTVAMVPMARGPLRLAHRGDWRKASENTIPALCAALDIAACDGLEFDVRASSDGVPVLIHDETLHRTHGRPDRVDAMTAAELEELGIPTLADALLAIGRGAFLDVELKGDPGRSVVEVLASGRGPDLQRAVVSSFWPGTLERIGSLAPAWPRWLNVWDLEPATIAAAVELGCRGIASVARAIDAEAAGRVREVDLDLIAFTVTDRATFDGLARLGVMAVCVEGEALDGMSGGDA